MRAMRPKAGAKAREWPTMKTKTITLAAGTSLLVNATVDIYTGRPMVELAHPMTFAPDVSLTAAQAERLAHALTRAAACVRAKAARSRRSR